MKVKCPSCMGSMVLLDSNSHGVKYMCEECGFGMRDNLWDQIRRNDPKARETIKKLMDECGEDEDLWERNQINVPTYMRLLIVAGLDDPTIKTKMLSEMGTFGLLVEDKDNLEELIAFMRRNIEASFET
jgi:hypothetical protein